MTFAVPTDGLTTIGQSRIFGPESESITPTTGTGTNTTVLETTHLRDITFLIRNTMNRTVTVQVQASDTAAFTAGRVWNVGSTVSLTDGSVTVQVDYVTVSDALPFLRINAIAASGGGTGTLECIAYCRAGAA